jgi:hypothetical protein
VLESKVVVVVHLSIDLTKIRFVRLNFSVFIKCSPSSADSGRILISVSLIYSIFSASSLSLSINTFAKSDLV